MKCIAEPELQTRKPESWSIECSRAVVNVRVLVCTRMYKYVLFELCASDERQMRKRNGELRTDTNHTIEEMRWTKRDGWAESHTSMSIVCERSS